MDSKFWLNSKTIWVNGLSLVAAIAAMKGLDINLGPDEIGVIVAGIMTVINVILRAFTKSAITLKKG